MDKEFLRKVATTHSAEILPPYDTIMEAGGFDAIYAIAENLGGLTIYVPSSRTIFSKCLEKAARQEFTGNNYAALARKYGYTERHMRRVVGAS
ncbi:MAG: hypothetical protein FWC78_05865 [Defluviitaleaceae bacterium]|nr:hypothetical protein [Defluviitaleaceae bacterium]